MKIVSVNRQYALAHNKTAISTIYKINEPEFVVINLFEFPNITI